MTSEVKRLLILCKTYPSPSAKYSETSCVAALDEIGNCIRLYPVPFRLIEDEQQFKKWQWITARIEKSRNDNRPESHKIYIDTIECDQSPLPTADNWRERRTWLDKLTTFGDFAELERARQMENVTLALLRPARITELQIGKAQSPDWTEDEKAKLLQMQQQADLFDDTDAKSIRLLKKVPFDFHYRYECDTPEGTKEYRHKIVDWEAGALFWNVRRRHGDSWEGPFRAKLEKELAGHDLMFLMGTMHRFPDQWLIVSLIYPPKQQPEPQRQGSLLLE
ncbi:MAG: hypothetical protein HYU77_14100 [Betaproteobacteria bacterium]|nr:hypothetical protein [Betaproteobacteria bacterium]